MPQAPRSNPRHEAQKAQEKESKRAKGAMSCAECRRLKLKCDKTVPCSSCKRRGCSQICPNGSLVTGQGTRFVLADTEKLHQKINAMSDRIRQLENALSLLHSDLTREPHPLLTKELLQIKSIIELHGAFSGETDSSVPRAEKSDEDVDKESQSLDAFGTLAIRDDGAATFYGRSAGSESLLLGEVRDSSNVQRHPSQEQEIPWQPSLPPAINTLASSFPFSSGAAEGLTLQYLVQHFLPPWEEAWRLSELYLETASWFYGAVTRVQLLEELLPTWYSEATSLVPPGVEVRRRGTPESDSGNSHGSAHDLALLFIIFCFAALTDISLPPAPDNPDTDKFYKLTCAALTLEPVLNRPPSVSTVQTLSCMAIYQGLVSGENSIESTWALYGLSTKLAQSIGLHRDCARWKLSPAEVQKRRALFWELFVTDCWQSLATGRIATFSLPFVDCELASDPDQTMADDGAIIPGFPAWKARFGAEVLSYVVDGALKARAPKYSAIIDLDRRIRNMELPKSCQGSPPQNARLAQTMEYFMPIIYRHLTLVYVHRCFFAQAIEDFPQDPMRSPYAPSFQTGYRSACELLNSVHAAFLLFPAHIARFWVLWTHSFSAAVLIASMVTRASGRGHRSKVTSAALLQLRSACDLFENAAAYGGRAVKFLPILQRLLQKAHGNVNSVTPPHTSSLSLALRESQKDELSIFSGQTHTVATRANSSSPMAKQPSSSSSVSTSSDYQSQESNYYSEMHPMLADQLDGFDGHLNAQIHGAYENEHQGPTTYLPIASSSYQQFQQPQFHISQSQPQASSSHHARPNGLYTSYNQTIPEPTHQYEHSVSYDGTSQFSNAGPSQSQQWLNGQHYPIPESVPSEPLPAHHYQQQPQQHQQQPHHYEEVPDPNTLQDTWASFMYTAGSPLPFTR